jgi:isocitrate/isopropylmalate dehydrogenase
MRHYNLAVMPGDGIGPEVITEGVAALQAVAELDGGLKFETQDYDWGSERYLRHGAMMPEDGLKVLEARDYNAILVGPVGDPRVADHITLWGMLLPIRQGFDQYINLRPVRLLEGVASPLAGKALRTSTSSAFARTAKANTAELAAGFTRERHRSRRCSRRCLPTMARSASCAMPSSMLAGTGARK